MPAARDATPALVRERVISQDLGIARQVILTPFSRFTESVRSIKVAADTSNLDLRVIGLISAVPGEGKSTIAVNLAQLAAHAGTRTLLIDADLRQPSLTRQIAPSANQGLLEVLDGSCDLQQAIWRDPVTGLDFLPSYLEAPIAHTSEILASRRMTDLLTQARELYDYVVVDFPPLAPVVDAKAASHLVDGFILVVEWGQTSPEIVVEALGSAEVVQSKLIGAVLNRANPAMLKRIELYKGKNYHRYYGNYGARA
jgi:succinoglycan biosynthesis transport protein ExoP